MPSPSRSSRLDDRAPVAAATVAPTFPEAAVSGAPKLLLVEFRSGEAVHQHPDVAPLLEEGWSVVSAVPRLVEGEGLRLLVVLKQLASQPVA